MKVLITGGAGFIGSRLAIRLADEGHAVTVLDCFLEQVHGSDPRGGEAYRALAQAARVIRGDVTDRASLTGALEGIEAVVHLAAETGTGQQSCHEAVIATCYNIRLRDQDGHLRAGQPVALAQ